ncbi:iron uptake system protein EfeO [Nocardioides iriomotensis]|uniref:iron uptake system protein EfeO n=1 Tax=Nocardioides iriomotensis TaxID=715784 RepID=UPI0019819875|nr:iron uptake system protein EfeO [Nocardioides iriomotensis]
MTRTRTLTLTALVAVSLLASACTDNSGGASGDGDDRTLAVTSTDDGCDVSSTEAPSGTLTFKVENAGSKVTEFYLLDQDGLRIVGEVENIGPGLTRNLVVTAPTGKYVTACKPGMKGTGIRADFQVEDSGKALAVSADDAALVEQASRNYAAYVQDQSAQLLAGTRAFVDAYESGDDDRARALYASTRVHWERIETVAESFGNLDPEMDLREADLEPGQKWTGWHRLEKDLWPPAPYDALRPKQRTTYAEDLLANTEELDSRVQDMTFGVDAIANGSRGLLEEVATGKVTGEEEFWSHTDLWDFQANVDGARVGFEGVRPVLEGNDKELAATLDRRFDELQTLLDQHRRGDGFVSYDELSDAEVKELADAVNALSEPLSRLTAAVVA